MPKNHLKIPEIAFIAVLVALVIKLKFLISCLNTSKFRSISLSINALESPTNTIGSSLLSTTAVV